MVGDVTAPYYSEDGITIFHGDCREVLPSLSADIAIMDPPYGVGFPYRSYDDTVENLDRLIADLFPLLPGRTATFAGVGNMHRWPQPTWTLCWLDPGGTGSGPWGFCTWQPVLVYGPDPYLKAGLGRRPDSHRSMLGRRPNKEDKDGSGEHSCPKPLDVMRWLVGRVAPDTADVIVDPTCGSGSTLRAAKDMGHRAIGIEQDERYCEIAAKRMAQGVLDFGAAS